MEKAAVEKALAQRETGIVTTETIVEADSTLEVHLPNCEVIGEPENISDPEYKDVGNLQIVRLKDVMDGVIPENEESINEEVQETVDVAVAEDSINLEMEDTSVVVLDTEDFNIEEMVLDMSPMDEDSMNNEVTDDVEGKNL